jgi:signal transduction histidine kinase
MDRTPLAPRSRCYECPVYRAARSFLEKPHELSLGERAVSVVSSFIELRETNELWEIIVFHDVTAEKLDAALKVAGAAAHELRQPLQVIMILAGLLERDLEGDESLAQHLATLTVSCERMDRIIERMSAITKYRTKEYVDGRKILDLEGSGDKS